MDQNVWVIENDLHLVGIGNEVGREKAAIELHAFNDIQFCLKALGLFNRDHTFIADPLHRLGEHFAHLAIAVGRNGADLGNLCAL